MGDRDDQKLKQNGWSKADMASSSVICIYFFLTKKKKIKTKPSVARDEWRRWRGKPSPHLLTEHLILKEKEKKPPFLFPLQMLVFFFLFP